MYLEKTCLLFCNLTHFSSLMEVQMWLVLQNFCSYTDRQTHKTPDYSNTASLTWARVYNDENCIMLSSVYIKGNTSATKPIKHCCSYIPACSFLKQIKMNFKQLISQDIGLLELRTHRYKSNYQSISQHILWHETTWI